MNPRYEIIEKVKTIFSGFLSLPIYLDQIREHNEQDDFNRKMTNYEKSKQSQNRQEDVNEK